MSVCHRRKTFICHTYCTIFFSHTHIYFAGITSKQLFSLIIIIIVFRNICLYVFYCTFCICIRMQNVIVTTMTIAMLFLILCNIFLYLTFCCCYCRAFITHCYKYSIECHFNTAAHTFTPKIRQRKKFGDKKHGTAFMKQTNQVTFTFFLHFCADSTADMMHNQEYIHRDSFLYENWCVDMEKSGMFKNILIRASKKRIKNYQRTNEKFQRRFFNVHTRDVYNSCILKMVMINAECRRRHTQKKKLYKRSQQQRKKCETINKAMMVICM